MLLAASRHRRSLRSSRTRRPGTSGTTCGRRAATCTFCRWVVRAGARRPHEHPPPRPASPAAPAGGSRRCMLLAASSHRRSWRSSQTRRPSTSAVACGRCAATCTFCRWVSAQVLGGHTNVHRRDPCLRQPASPDDDDDAHKESSNDVDEPHDAVAAASVPRVQRHDHNDASLALGRTPADASLRSRGGVRCLAATSPPPEVRGQMSGGTWNGSITARGARHEPLASEGAEHDTRSSTWYRSWTSRCAEARAGVAGPPRCCRYRCRRS